MRLLIIAMAFVASATFAQTKTLNDYFPAKYKNWEVKRKPLEAKKREALKKEGISDTTLDLYGDVFVSGYGADEFRWGDLKLKELGPEKVTYDTTGMRKLLTVVMFSQVRLTSAAGCSVKLTAV